MNNDNKEINFDDNQIANTESILQSDTFESEDSENHEDIENNPVDNNQNKKRDFNSRNRGYQNNRFTNRNTGNRDFGNRFYGQQKNFIPEVAPGNIRIIPLGGVEEVGRNMTAFEIGDDIIVVDMGFAFKDEATPGVDYILPNTEYLEQRKHKIRGVIITHAHLDHIGAIPYLMGKIGNPKIYCRNFTALMIKKRQEEFIHLPPLNIITIETSDSIVLGNTKVKFFAVTHSIPDAMGIMINTPYGNVVHTGDLRLDHDDGVPSPFEEEVYSIFQKEKALCLLADSTNSENPGFSLSDRVVMANIEKIITNTSGRLIAAMFSSQVDRMIKLLQIAEELGKKVVIEGRSMKTNIEVIKIAGMLPISESTIIPIEEMYKYPDNKVVCLVTGSQGEEFGTLMRIATKTHKYIALKPNDTILMSSSIIPGNERSVQKLKDLLARQGSYIIHYKTSDVHSSGHANQDEQAWIISKINPDFFIPIHGHHFMLRAHAETAKIKANRIPENIIIPENGSIIEIQNEGKTIKKLLGKAPSSMVYVDGFAVGAVQEVVIKDRQALSQDGVFVTAVIVDSRTGMLRKSPDIVSRGFVYLKESQELLRQVRLLIRKKIEDNPQMMHSADIEDVRNDLNETIAKFFVKKTGKSPIVMSIVIGV
jgi:ribonuclease J